MDIVTTIVRTIGPVLGPIWTGFTYLNDYDKNFQDLDRQVKYLEEHRASVQMLVEKAKRNTERILPRVTSWISRADESIEDARNFLQKEDRENGRCLYGPWCLVCRYCQSSSAKEKTQVLEKVRTEGDFGMVSILEPPVRMEDPTGGNIKEFGPRKHIEEDVMAALENPEVNVIGICGLLGVGKTKLAEKVSDWAKDKKLFDEVIMVVVSQTPNLEKIQCEVAESIGMELKDKTLSVRAKRLRERLMKEERVLIILDDVWEKMNLKELGIFSFGEDHNGGSKIMLTSRNRRVCRDMGAEIFILEPLTPREAMSVFAEMAAISIDDLKSDPVKRLVAYECKCLPGLLDIVGRAVKNQSKSVWDAAHLQLKRRVFETLSEVRANVYQPLESCYNNMKSQEAKYLLLLCCLIPENVSISIDDLVIYGMSLNLFRGIEAVVEARDRVCALVEDLKDDFLLLDCDWSPKDTKMLAVVHEAMSIASKDVRKGFLIDRDVNLKELSTYEHSTAMSIIVDESTELPPILKCPRLEILRLVRKNYASEVLPYNFFTELEKLKVLEIRNLQIASLPSSLGLLTSLQTLRIMGCWSIENISVVGKLVNLENLSLSNSSMVVLPEEIGNLKKLRLLELWDFRSLRTIPPGVIAGLHRLEALSMKDMYSFTWEVEEDGKKRSNASLKDLESLAKLTTLEISLGELELIPRSLRLCSKLTRYAIYIGIHAHYVSLDWHKFMQLTLPRITTFPNWVCERIKESEVLRLKSDGSKSVVDELNLNGFLHLKELRIEKCRTLDYLTNAVHGRLPPSNVIFPFLNTLHLSSLANLIGLCGDQLPIAGSFRELKELWLSWLPSLTHLWKGPTQNVFLSNLRWVYVHECGSLVSLLSLSIASSAVQLEELEVRNCGKLVEVFSDESGDGEVTSKIKFPKLKKIYLKNLRSLIHFCGRIDDIEFPRLNELKVCDLPMINEFCPKSYNDNVCELQSLFDQKLDFGILKRLILDKLQNVSEMWCRQIQTSSFSKLEQLEVDSCNNLIHLFYASMARALMHLRHLKVVNCPAMEEVVVKEEKEAEDERRMNEILFPQLRDLVLDSLPNLKSFFQVKHGLDLPSLDQLRVYGCPELEAFSLGSLSTPKLTAVSSYRDDWVHDLNTTIRYIYAREKFGRLKLFQLHELQNVSEMLSSQFQTSSFSILAELEVESCNNLRHLFYSSVARALMQLRHLIIINCQAMEVVVVKEEKEAEDERRMNEILFPQLSALLLDNLPNLSSFFQVKHELDLPSLDVLYVGGCPELQAFSLGSLNTPKLKAVVYANEEFWVHDLNTTIRQIYEKEKEYVEANEGEACETETSEGEASEVDITEGFEYIPPSLEESSTKPVVLEQSSQSLEQGSLVRPEQKQAKPKLNVHHMTNLENIKYLTQFLDVIRPFIARVIDVPGDGHCGFRVVAKFMDLEDNGWKKVRKDILYELETFETVYLRVFYDEKQVAELKHSTQCEDANVDREHWLTMLDMGHVIASCYNIVVVLISSEQCLTFLPLRQQAPPETSHRILGLGYVNSNHFVGLEFTRDSPLPPVSNMWNDHHNELAKGWITPYEKRIEKFQAMLENDTNVATVEHLTA